jgi:hypothetical protein
LNPSTSIVRPTVWPFCTSVGIDNSPRFVGQLPHLIDLSKATKLRDVTFVCGFDPRWIIWTLQTITVEHKDFKQVFISSPDTLHRLRTVQGPGFTLATDVLGEEAYMEWLELDRLLVQLHEIRSIRLGVFAWVDDRTGRRGAECLLPEVVSRGISDLEGFVL